MDKLSELRIRADMAKRLGAAAMAEGLEIAIGILEQPDAPELELTPPPVLAQAYHRRRWTPTEDTELAKAWTGTDADAPTPLDQLSTRFKRTMGAVHHRAVRVLELAPRDIDAPFLRDMDATASE